jgi:hypothetical protein
MAEQQQVTIPVITSKEEMRAFSRQQKLAGKTVAFVPTMVRQSWRNSHAAPPAQVQAELAAAP